MMERYGGMLVMQRISDNYYHQKSNKMHWDTNSEWGGTTVDME